jgi:hypothetical protein
MKAIAVDFDGVIHAYTKGWNGGQIYDEPVAGVYEALTELMEKYAVFIHTTRDVFSVKEWIEARLSIPCKVGDAGEFWNEQGVLLVTRRKYPALAYIDDRGIRFTSWPDALTQLETYEGE